MQPDCNKAWCISLFCWLLGWLVCVLGRSYSLHLQKSDLPKIMKELWRFPLTASHSEKCFFECSRVKKTSTCFLCCLFHSFIPLLISFISISNSGTWISFTLHAYDRFSSEDAVSLCAQFKWAAGCACWKGALFSNHPPCFNRNTVRFNGLVFPQSNKRTVSEVAGSCFQKQRAVTTGFGNSLHLQYFKILITLLRLTWYCGQKQFLALNTFLFHHHPP